MKFLTITGIGPGDPSLLTLAAVDAIQESTAAKVNKEGSPGPKPVIVKDFI